MTSTSTLRTTTKSRVSARRQSLQSSVFAVMNKCLFCAGKVLTSRLISGFDVGGSDVEWAVETHA